MAVSSLVGRSAWDHLPNRNDSSYMTPKTVIRAFLFFASSDSALLKSFPKRLLFGEQASLSVLIKTVSFPSIYESTGILHLLVAEMRCRATIANETYS